MASYMKSLKQFQCRTKLSLLCRYIHNGGLTGRNSFNGTLATVFGGETFLARYVINRLCQAGSQVVVVHECDPFKVRYLKTMGDLGQINLMGIGNMFDDKRVKETVQYSNVVINLIDNLNSYRKSAKMNIEIPKFLSNISSCSNVKKFVHLSSFGANHNSNCKILFDKACGEVAVKKEFPNVITVRPTLYYGPEDVYMSYFGRITSPMALLMMNKGSNTIKRPVFVSDVASAIVKCALDPSIKNGSVVELFNTKQYYLDDIMRFSYDYISRSFPESPLFYQILKLGKYLPNSLCKSFNMPHNIFENETDPSIGCLSQKDIGIDFATLEEGLINFMRFFKPRLTDLRYNTIEKDIGICPTVEDRKIVGNTPFYST